MKSNGRQAPKPVSLSQCVAVVVTFRRLLVVYGIAPLLLAASPIVAGVYIAVMDFATSGFGFLSTAIAAALTIVVRSYISSCAPDAKLRNEILSSFSSRVSLPLVSFAIGRMLISFILYPLASWFGIDGLLKVSPQLPYMAVLRISACMLLLGAAILVRFVGPVSVVRCSETPLRSHPLSDSIYHFWKRCTSLDALLGLVALPSDKHGELLYTSFPVWRETNVRYHRPSLRASVGQILLSTIIGVVVAHSLPVWQRFSSDPLAQMVLIASCVLTLLTHLIMSSLDGSSHELDPKLYQSVKPQYVMSLQQVPSLFRTLGLTVAIVPAVAVAVVCRVDDEDASPHGSSVVSLAFLGLVVTALISAYLTAINEASKTALCMPGLVVEHCVKQFSRDPYRDTLIVMAESILQGNSALARSVLDPTRSSGVMYAEDEELKRGVADMDQMARVLLCVDRHIDRTDAMLENDILCMLVMENLGGTGCSARVAFSTEADRLSSRHFEGIKQWADPENAAWMGAARREPNVVPLVRALCAYAGGMGEALLTVSLPPNSSQRLALNEGSVLTSWSLPPAARACSEWAIRAAGRLIVHSLRSTKGPVSDWRSSSLSFLVPTMLLSAFTLRKGTLSFAGVRHDQDAGVQGDVLLTDDNAVLNPILLSCHESALMVVQTLASIGGNQQLNASRMGNDCRLWLDKVRNEANASH